MNGSYCLKGTVFQFEKIKKFDMVVMVARHCEYCHFKNGLNDGISLIVQWLRLCFQHQGACV